MNEKSFFKLRLYATGIVTLAIWSLLAWNYFHGGVPSHNILAKADMPSISNWWGAVLLPSLTWFLLYRTQKRLDRSQETSKASVFRHILYGFLGALIFGILIASFFILKYVALIDYLMYGFFVLAFLYPVYRAECLLAFVIGMTFTFGAVLPTAFGTMLVIISAIIFLYLRPALLYLVAKLISLFKPAK